MGDKIESKVIMEKAGVPLVPGYHGSDQSLETLVEESKKIGFPVLVKAALGGGGKGMKIATSEADCVDAIQSAQREALSSFGDQRVLLERYVGQPRHIEVQVSWSQPSLSNETSLGGDFVVVVLCVVFLAKQSQYCHRVLSPSLPLFFASFL